ncbi:LysR substrate-binding domain-containing protein [Pusillimonas sp. SM2304]|uniref:LysR family transcriptional regulator n=1 Tax=Pusillimonas sp. SM2304 TaxID=3073241 RepID=UPI0028765F4E|nr:LysR substrate-binding domain-containing protein [Pusillimonas sp. SM2304]MDS1141434.1 LysR substrate-binding domain-containing protein [Pusillimonas sp. SM2304]
MKRINFDLRELQAFIAVAERLSFRVAAEELHLSAPALSRRIDKLETMLGVKLLERSTRHVELTNVGRVFLEHARSALGELEGAMLGISDLAAKRSGVVTVACVPSVAYYFLPTVIDTFAQRYPLIRVRILDEGANTVLNDVVNRRADFGINFIGTQEMDLEFEPIFSERFVLAVHAGHRLARRRKVRWEELCDERFIAVGKSSGNRVLLDSALAQSPRRPTSFFEVAHVSSLLGLVEARLGVAAVPQLALPPHNHSTLKGIPLVCPEVSRTLGLLRKKHNPLPHAAQILYDLIKEEADRR